MGTKTRLMASRLLAAVSPSKYAGVVHQPVFIVGFNKSGKTLLKNILSTHPEIISYPGEANELWHPHLYPWHRSDLSVPPIWIDPHRFVERSLADWTPQYRMAIKARFGAYQKLSSKRVLLVDSAMIAFMLPNLVELFPEARFIHFYRDGRVSSYITSKKEHSKFLKHRAIYQRAGFCFEHFADVASSIASYWAATMAEIKQQRTEIAGAGKNSLLELSYEEFCANPYDCLERILAFLDIPPAPLKADHVRDTNKKIYGQVPPEIDELLTHQIGIDLKTKGYLILPRHKGPGDPLANAE